MCYHIAFWQQKYWLRILIKGELFPQQLPKAELLSDSYYVFRLYQYNLDSVYSRRRLGVS
jgi:hypothetical protein